MTDENAGSRTICAVTGANGFVGSHLVESLLACGYEVRAVVRKTSNIRWLEGTSAKLVYGRLNAVDSLAGAFDGADYVFHLAGVVAARRRADYFRINADGTRNVLEACLRVDTHLRKIVFVSSQAAGGPSSGGRPATEDDPPNPVTSYGKSKLAAERIAAEYFDRLNIAIVRPPAIYGPRDTEIFRFVKIASRFGVVPIGGKSDIQLSIAHVSDVVRGIIAAARAGGFAGRTCYIAGPEDTTWRELVEVLSEALGRKLRMLRPPVPIAWVLACASELGAAISGKAAVFNREKIREITAEGWLCSIQRARDETGFEPQIGFREGMKSTVKWYQEQGWLK